MRAMAIPFNYASEYKRKLRTPDEAARVVKSGDWIDISMGTGSGNLAIPYSVLEELKKLR